MIKFDLPKNQSSIIKVMGIGGGGSNAVSNMFNEGIRGVDFIICNTDAQALEASPVPTKIQLGNKGLGAGSIPSVGRESALEKADEIRELLEKHTQMLFITAGMGGGTGTGAAPVIAEIAKELGVLTVAIVTMPFSFEGRKRRMQAEEGVEELKKHVDTLLIIVNDKLRLLSGDLKLSQAFAKADTVLTTAAKGIAEIITVTGYINVDFEDVKTVMKDSGTAIMGSAIVEGEGRATKAVQEALESPLLNDNKIEGASDILLYIASGEDEISMDEVMEVTDFIQREAGPSADIIWGNGVEDTLGKKISITLIATGFDTKKIEPKEKIVHNLNDQDKDNEDRVESKEEKAVESKTENIELIRKKEEKSPEADPKTSVERTIVFDLTTGEKKTKEKPSVELKETSYELKKEESKAEEEKAKIQNKGDVKEREEKVHEELEKMSQERIQKLKDLSVSLRTSRDLSKLEDEPAYIRRNVKLSDTPLSSESQVSRFYLSEKKDDDNSNLKKNNSFLHDKPD